MCATCNCRTMGPSLTRRKMSSSYTASMKPDPQRDQQRRNVLHKTRIFEWPRVDSARSRDFLHQLFHHRLGLRAVAADQHIAIHRMRQVGQRHRAEAVERGNGRHIRRQVGGCLLRGRTGPRGDHVRDAVAQRSAQWYGRVHEDCSGTQALANHLDGRNLRHQGHGEHRHVGLRGGFRVQQTVNQRLRHSLSHTRGGGAGLLGVARADDHRDASLRPAQRQPESLGASPA